MRFWYTLVRFTMPLALIITSAVCAGWKWESGPH
jgi:hypothetical protein